VFAKLAIKTKVQDETARFVKNSMELEAREFMFVTNRFEQQAKLIQQPTPSTRDGRGRLGLLFVEDPGVCGHQLFDDRGEDVLGG
jgi:hypothetical protein